MPSRRRKGQPYNIKREPKKEGKKREIADWKRQKKIGE
jgi:hypothetical protein